MLIHLFVHLKSPLVVAIHVHVCTTSPAINNAGDSKAMRTLVTAEASSTSISFEKECTELKLRNYRSYIYQVPQSTLKILCHSKFYGLYLLFFFYM